MLLGGDVPGAEAAVWRRDAVDPRTAGYPRVPPILVIRGRRPRGERGGAAGEAKWYLGHGVAVVWLVLPETCEVIAVTAGPETRHGVGDRLPPHRALLGLEPAAERFFRQLG